MEQLRARKLEIDEAGQGLVREYADINREIERRENGGLTRATARTIHQRILTDDGTLPHFARASQNIAAVMALLHSLPEATTSEDRRAHREIRTLLERAAAQQAESSLSQRRELNTSQRMPSVRPAKDASVHQTPPSGRQHAAILVHQRLGHNRDARSTIDARRRTYGDPREGAHHDYHPRCGRHYDSGKDRGPSPGLPGPQAFGRHILNAAFLPRYRLPTNIPKCSGETNPGLWL